MSSSNIGAAENRESELKDFIHDDLRRHRVGVDVWHVGLFEHDHSSNAVYTSTRLREIYGVPLDQEMTFMQLATAVHPEDNDLDEVRRAHDPSGDGSFDKRFRIIRPDGEIRWVHSRAQTVFGVVDDKPAPLITTGTVIDITEQHLLKTALEENKQRLADILDSLPSVVIGVDSANRITLWNSTAASQTNITENQALYKTVTTYFPLLERELENIEKARTEQITIDKFKVPWSSKDETSFFNISFIPLLNAESKEVVVRIDDVTKQVRFERMLVQSEKLVSVGGLAAGMAHEINNPLAAVLQNIQVISNRFKPAHPLNQQVAQSLDLPLDKMNVYLEQRKIFKMIAAVEEAGNRAATIVRNMLSFVRVSNNRHSDCNLAELMDTTLELAQNDYNLAQKTDFRKIEICREYDPDLRLVRCDPGKMQQVFLNLLKNAGQAMFEAQTPSPTITVRIKPYSTLMRVEFEDNGPGILEQASRRIFDPFFTTKQVGAGTGLGLSISYFIVTKEHQGNIQFENGTDHGAKFIIDLP